ncbi:MAG: fasciclin domain-containing protein [Flavobacteriaceae bacterium]|nr:fasciclin domain-containing protein [Flavobacteriaceae bacterium]
MKTTNHLKKFTLLLAVVFMAYSCSNDDDNTNDPPQSTTITALASASGDLSILVAALQRAGLDTTLDTAGDFTVFAPTNTAFANFLADNNFTALEDIPVDVLTQVLLNHVIDGEAFSTALSTGYGNTLATKPGTGENLSIYIDTSNGVSLNGVSNVEQADIDASNGVIHIVDAVIGLPNIVDHAVANSDLSSLVGALTAGGNTTFTTLLSTPGDFTVFAPNNDAFASFTTSNDLASVLANHVIPGATAISTGLSNSYVNTAAMLSGTMTPLSMYINVDSGVTINGSSNVVAADIVATNGVIHVVDEVIDLPTIATFATSNAALSILVDALAYADTGMSTVDYIDTVSDATTGPFTVFAPTNDAFVSLLAELELNALTDLTPEQVDAVLLYHIVNANVQSSQLQSGTVATLGGNITVDATAFTLTDPNGRLSNIIPSLVDIQAANGVVHVIDKVLLNDD